MVSIDNLRCQYCANLVFERREANLICVSCRKSAIIKEEKIFFVEPPQNAAVNPVTDPRDKRRWTPLRLAQYQFLSSVLDLFPSVHKLCDVGAGPGQFRDLYKRFTPVSIDFFPYHEIDIIADLEKPLPFRDSIFDIVASTNTLEHIHRAPELVQECFRILGPQGILVGSTPFLIGIHQAPYDFHRFTNFELGKMLQDAGFVDIKVIPLASAFDWYKTSQLHFFMTLFDAARHKSFIARFGYLVFSKIAWNIQKILSVFFSRLYKINKNTEHVLGYGFVARKPR